MAQLFRELDEHYSAIIRKSVIGVTRDIMRLTGVSEDTKINYNGNIQAQPHVGSTMGSMVDNNPTGKGALFTVEVTEDLKEETILTTPIYYENAVAVFLDKDIDVLIKPVYTKAEISINISARFTDRASAVAWKHSVRMYSSIMRAENLHEITYNWDIPRVFLVLLYQIYQCRDRIAGYADTLDAWLKAKSSVKITTAVNQAGKHPTLAVTENQMGVIGWFDFIGQPDEPEYDKDKGTYTYQFNYRINLDLPIGAYMRYPLMIHNQVLHEKFRPDNVPYRLREKFHTPGVVKVLLDSMAKQYFPVDYALKGLSFPIFDDWLPAQIPVTQNMLLRIMLAIDPDNPTDVIKLDDLGISHHLDPELIAYIANAPEKVLRVGESFLHARLYMNDMPTSQQFLTIDSELNINAVEPLSLRTPHHLLISMLHDFTELSRAARDDLQEYGAVALKYFQILDPTLPSTDIWPTLTQGGRIRKEDFLKIEKHFERRGASHYRHVELSARFVALCTIESHKRGNLDAVGQ